MSHSNFFKFIISIVISEAVGVAGALFTTSAIPLWYTGLVKPALNPPAWVFGPVWTALFALIGISFYLVWKNGWKVSNPIHFGSRKTWNKWSERFWEGDLRKQNTIAIFWIQYFLNFMWTLIFFGLRMPGLAFFEILALIVSVIYLIVNFYRISKLAAWLLLPYLLWILFAAYLNCAIWILNLS